MIAVDIETLDKGKNGRDGFIICVGLYDGNDYVCCEPSDPRLPTWLASKEDKVFHNGVYDLPWLLFNYGWQVGGIWHDTMTRTALIDEYSDLDLTSCCNKFKVKGKNAADTIELWWEDHRKIYGLRGKLWDHADVIWMVPDGREQMIKYNKQDCIATYNLFMAQEPYIKNDNLTEVYDLECRLYPVIMEMRKNGIRIDPVARDRFTAFIEQKRVDTLRQLEYKYAITESIIASPKQLGIAMNKLGIKSEVTTAKGNQSWSADALDLIDHPVTALIQETKNYNALLTKYLYSSFRDDVINGRIYSTFSPNKRDDGGTITGRLSSRDPNLQQVPARDDKHGQKSYGQEMRMLFIPDDYCMMAAIDYSQIEYLLLAHFAVGQQADWFREQANNGVDFHTVAQQMTGIKSRDVIKRMNYGFIYGMGINKLMSINRLLFKKLAAEVNLDVPTFGKQLYEQYHRRLPVIKDTMRAIEMETKLLGYCTSIGGRRHHKPKPVFQDGRWNSGIYKMSNYKIQGCQLPSARIHTTEGLLRFDELPEHTTAKIIYNNSEYDFDWLDTGIKHCYTFITAEHTKLTLSDETPQLVIREQGEILVKAKDIIVGDILPLDEVVSGGKKVGIFTPVKKAHNQKLFDIDGDDPFIWYLCGYLLGDGGVYSSGTTLSFNSITDVDQLNYITAGLEQYGIHYNIVPHVYSKDSLRIIFRSATLEQFYSETLDWDLTKYIPTKMFQLLPEHRRQIIKAMMDSDGTNTHNVSWVSANEKLALGFIELLASVGLYAKLDFYSQPNCYRIFIRNQDTYMQTIGFLCGYKNRLRKRINNKSMPKQVWDIIQPLFNNATLPNGYRNTSIATCFHNAKNNIKQLGRDMTIKLLALCNIPIPTILQRNWTTVTYIKDIGLQATNDIHVHSNEHLYTSWLGTITHNSAAEILKKGLVDCWEAGIFSILPLHITVHDENVVSVPYNKVGTEALIEMKRIMEAPYRDRLLVPMKAVAEVGPNWGWWAGDIWKDMQKGIFNRDLITGAIK